MAKTNDKATENEMAKATEKAMAKVEVKADAPKVADEKAKAKKLAIPFAKMVTHVKSAGDLPKVTEIPKTDAPKADTPKAETPKVHEDAKVHAKIEDVSKPADENAKIEYPKVKKPSAGKQIRDLFQLAIDKKLIADNVVIDLQSAEFCKTKLKIRYPFLMMATESGTADVPSDG